MKKIIEIELPDFIGNEFIALLSLLSQQELSQLKGIAAGLLLGSGKYSVDDIVSICKNTK